GAASIKFIAEPDPGHFMSGVHSLSIPMVGRSLTLRVAPAATPAMLHNTAAGVVPNVHAEGKVRLGFHGQVRLHSPWPGIVYKPCRCILLTSPGASVPERAAISHPHAIARPCGSALCFAGVRDPGNIAWIEVPEAGKARHRAIKPFAASAGRMP